MRLNSLYSKFIKNFCNAESVVCLMFFWVSRWKFRRKTSFDVAVHSSYYSTRYSILSHTNIMIKKKTSVAEIDVVVKKTRRDKKIFVFDFEVNAVVTKVSRDFRYDWSFAKKLTMLKIIQIIRLIEKKFDTSVSSQKFVDIFNAIATKDWKSFTKKQISTKIIDLKKNLKNWIRLLFMSNFDINFDTDAISASDEIWNRLLKIKFNENCVKFRTKLLNNENLLRNLFFESIAIEVDVITSTNFVIENDIVQKMYKKTIEDDFQLNVENSIEAKNESENENENDCIETSNEFSNEIAQFDQITQNSFFSTQATLILRSSVKVFSLNVFSIVEIFFFRSFFFSSKRAIVDISETKSKSKRKKKTLSFSQKSLNVMKIMSQNVNRFLIKNIVESNIKFWQKRATKQFFERYKKLLMNDQLFMIELFVEKNKTMQFMFANDVDFQSIWVHKQLNSKSFDL